MLVCNNSLWKLAAFNKHDNVLCQNVSRRLLSWGES